MSTSHFFNSPSHSLNYRVGEIIVCKKELRKLYRSNRTLIDSLFCVVEIESDRIRVRIVASGFSNVVEKHTHIITSPHIFKKATIEDFYAPQIVFISISEEEFLRIQDRKLDNIEKPGIPI